MRGDWPAFHSPPPSGLLTYNRPAGGPLWKLDKDLKLRADLTQNDTISPCRVLDQVASMGFQLFACPECEYQNVYVFVRRDGGL